MKVTLFLLIFQLLVVYSMAEKIIKLPEPKFKGRISVEEVIKKRRSIRSYKDKPLELEKLSQLCFSAYGITGKEDFKRSAPSAGALYPLEIFILVNRVEGLEKGIYQYIPQKHSLLLIKNGDFKKELALASLNQLFIQEAALSFLIAADYLKTTSRYGERGKRYVEMDVGHVGQNIYLQSTSLGLGTCAVGAFYDEDIKKLFLLPQNLSPLYIFPVGYPK